MPGRATGSQAQVRQTPRSPLEGLADAFCHGAHLGRQGAGHARHPRRELRQRHAAGLVQRDAAKQGRAGCCRQAAAAAVGTQLLFEEFFHPLHALFVLDLGQRILHRIDGVKIGKIKLPGLIGIFGVIEDVLFLGRAVVDDVLFPVAQLPKGHVGAHAHLPADVDHQRPHEGIPGRHGALLKGQRLVGHQGVQVHRAHDAGAAAGAAGPLAVEGQLLGAGGVKGGAALGTVQLKPCRHVQRGRQIVPVRAAVAGKP